VSMVESYFAEFKVESCVVVMVESYFAEFKVGSCVKAV
jgi:hypothetical protein